jgi:hypothetical protein
MVYHGIIIFACQIYPFWLYPPVINRGSLEHPPFVNDFSIKNPPFGDFQLP